MGSTGELMTSFLPNGVPSIQNVFVPNGHQTAAPNSVPANGNSFFQSSYPPNVDPSMGKNYMPNAHQHSNVAPSGNPNTGNYVSFTNGSAPTFGNSFAANAFPVNSAVQTPHTVLQDSYAPHGAPLAGGNAVQIQNSVQVQQNYTNYGAPLLGGSGVPVANPTASIGFVSNGAPPIGNSVVPNGNSMVDSSGNLPNGGFTASNNYGPNVQPNYAPDVQPIVGNNCMPYGDPNTWNNVVQNTDQTVAMWPQTNWNSTVQNTDQTVGNWPQTNRLQEGQSYSQPSGVDPMTLQLEWEAYQAILNQEKDKNIPDNQGLKDLTFSEGYKATPCTNFFSTSGCAHGENCHFTHYVPGGINTLGFTGPVNGVRSRNGVSNAAGIQANSVPSGPVSGYKTRLCTRYASLEGCKFGDKCHFAHGESELRVPSTYLNGQQGGQAGQVEKPPVVHANTSTSFANQPMGTTTIYYGEPSPPGVTATVMIGATSFTKLAIDAAYVGAVIGKAGSNIKQINKATGCKVSIREHVSNPNMRNVEMEGTLEQIEKASEMVRQLLQQKDAGAPRANMVDAHNFKTRLCENFNAGSCSYGDRCHFAHGAHELRTASR
ncbi:hypothetical protein O6H91_23G003200 [Diphasiastrum complanatum]|uniref:Uncharacterized protein n=3 Tax=Diphasiastrum complanatum TaxID=34168 RepID=A0ACC2A7T5_DIPCM|nr:hypothetical protein O6H91_23G003200 [Diphasiastrum complanatum]KAJ7513527.1 hypothetical protein O6H91_23G003200 [Diphasiastrum complanatum]KAJ7513529.1 hypothetical protein O6H91_23G003200 [Diphasiastrum complanatum]